MESIIHLLKILDESLSEDILRESISEMLNQGYKCAGAFADDKLVGICGIWILTKYYIGKHIEPDNLIVIPEYRSKGVERS